MEQVTLSSTLDGEVILSLYRDGKRRVDIFLSAEGACHLAYRLMAFGKSQHMERECVLTGGEPRK